jgi:hypothetical protein
MNRDQVISLMCDIVNHLNEQIGKSQNLSDEEIQKIIESHQENLLVVNSVLYDELFKRGVIA